MDSSDPELLAEQAADDASSDDETDGDEKHWQTQSRLDHCPPLVLPTHGRSRSCSLIESESTYAVSACTCLSRAQEQEESRLFAGHIDRASAAQSSTSLASFTMIASRRATLDANCAVCCTVNGGFHKDMRSICSCCRALLSASSACQRLA
jgi:hypothetical protein